MTGRYKGSADGQNRIKLPHPSEGRPGARLKRPSGAPGIPGPDIPDPPPPGIAPPELARETMDWTATHTLKVMALLDVVELAWRAHEPPRIIAFSRGDWEDALSALADPAQTPRR